MTKVVAMTGGIGSGKSAACACFTQLGVPVVDLDVIARAMSAPGSPAMRAVAQAFGEAMFQPDGHLDRAKLRELVFANPDALEQLNDIMHPAIREEALRQIRQHDAVPYVVLAIPLLVESKADWQSLINHVLVIDCSEQTQIERVMQRSQLSRAMAEAIMAAQGSRAERLAIADTVIDNSGDVKNLEQKVAEFHEKFPNACL